LLYAAAAIPTWFGINPLLSAAFPAVSDTLVFLLVDILLFAGIPVAIGVAIFKYRLYDIDILINRTLVYGSLTVTLVALYFVSIVLSQRFFVVLTGGGVHPLSRGLHSLDSGDVQPIEAAHPRLHR
jgi:hypothetical protein